ncbi:MAG: hypothetical protein ACRCTY_02770 [Candidatus Adiutrix sp.]
MDKEKYNMLKGLWQGGRGTLSMGRVAFWLTLAIAVYFWLARPVADFPPSLADTLMFVLAYNLGGKAAHIFGAKGGSHG